MDVSQRAGFDCHFYNTGILYGLQVPLGDVDVLMAQQTGYRVHIQTITQVGLSEVVAGSVRGAADICADICLGCSLFKNTPLKISSSETGEMNIVAMRLPVIKEPVMKPKDGTTFNTSLER